MAVKVPLARRIVNTFASVRTGIILLIIVGVIAAAGTLILQRPITEPSEMQRAYSPQVLDWLDRLGLTDVFHSWWWTLLLGLLAASIVLASLERFPNVWRYFARPYRRPDEHFRAVLPLRKEFRIRDAAAGLEAAERAFAKVGLKPERVTEHDEVSLYAERSRFAVLGAYVVHVALLLVLAGYIVDAVVGYSGYMALTAGHQPKEQIQGQAGVRQLPFAVRCDSAGRENYADGTPKQWWSRLTVLENGREVMQKQIVVNDPLVYRGIRFYQSGFDDSSELQRARIEIVNRATGARKTVELSQTAASAALDDGATLKLLRFVPDAYSMDGSIYQRSRDLNNAAAEIQITKQGQTSDFWMFRAEQAEGGGIALVGPYDTAGNELTDTPYRLAAELQMAPLTVLQVSYHPGQLGIWLGVIVLGIGLGITFYFVHMRFWALPVSDRQGGLVLWVGAAASKHREALEDRFRALTEEIENQLKAPKVRVAGAGR